LNAISNIFLYLKSRTVQSFCTKSTVKRFVKKIVTDLDYSSNFVKRDSFLFSLYLSVMFWRIKLNINLDDRSGKGFRNKCITFRVSRS